MVAGQFAALIDPGRARSNNEDVAIAGTMDDGRLVLLVADGVGGAAGGEVASELAADHAIDVLTTTTAPPADAMPAAFVAANRAVWQHASAVPDLEGMATTMVLALVDGRTAWVQHVGDSRAYLHTAQGLTPLTIDHRLVTDMVNDGQITQQQADKHPYRNVITRAIGIGPEIDPGRLLVLELEPGDVLLLCTDGLSETVADSEIAAILAQDVPVARIAADLVAHANAAGGPDNIGVALYRAA